MWRTYTYVFIVPIRRYFNEEAFTFVFVRQLAHINTYNIYGNESAYCGQHNDVRIFFLFPVSLKTKNTLVYIHSIGTNSIYCTTKTVERIFYSVVPVGIFSKIVIPILNFSTVKLSHELWNYTMKFYLHIYHWTWAALLLQFFK